MNGAERLLETLVESGVELCFANPGTSEMQLVSAIGNSEKMRAVSCVFSKAWFPAQPTVMPA